MTEHALTKSGRRVQLTQDASSADDDANIHIRDIAAHLSKIAWIPEAPDHFYSVAERSSRLADALKTAGPTVQMFGLLDRAYMAYRCPSWASGHMNARIRQALRVQKFSDPGYGRDIAHAIEVTERELAAAEARDLLHENHRHLFTAPPVTTPITPWPWPRAEEEFLKRYKALAVAAGMPVRMEP